MKNRNCVAGLVASALLVACGGGSDESSEMDETEAYAEENSSSLADLPDDFPNDLVPPEYASVNYLDMKHINGTELASFESLVPVQRSIDHYVALLGEPTIDVDAGEGERSVQWHSTPWSPWIVGVIGSDKETIVAVSKLPEE